MGKDKRKGKEKSNSFDYRYKTGDIGDMMRRYDIEGTQSYHPNMRGPGSGNENRTKEDVERDIAKAMMNDYDTRRGMEAAAMAGDKDAKKFAKKGFKEGNIYSAYDTMKALKKEYVGGGGMDGAKNRAGLTQALVKADRKNFIADNDAKYASKADLENMKPAEDPDTGYTDPQMTEESDKLKQAKERTQSWKDGGLGANDPTPYGDEPKADDEQASATVMPTNTEGGAQSYLEGFKKDLKSRANFKGDF
jgi:hypothetical protein